MDSSDFDPATGIGNPGGNQDLPEVKPIYNDSNERIKKLLGTTREILVEFGESSGSLAQYVAGRLNVQMMAFNTAPTSVPAAPDLGKVPEELVRQVDDLLNAWKSEVAAAHALEGFDLNDEEATSLCACRCLGAIFANEFEQDGPRIAANIFNVAIRTGIVSFITGSVHRLAGLYLGSSNTTALVGICGVAYASSVTLIRMLKGWGDPDVAGVAILSKGLLLLGMLAALTLAATEDLAILLMSFMSMRVATSIFRDSANAFFSLGNNTKGLFVPALIVSGLSWTAINVLELFATGAFNAQKGIPQNDTLGNLTNPGVPEDALRAEQIGREISSVFLNASVYALGEIFDDYVQPLVQSYWEDHDTKKRSAVSQFDEEHYRKMTKRLAGDAREILASEPSKRGELADAKNKAYKTAHKAYLQSKKRQFDNLSSAETALLGEKKKLKLQDTDPASKLKLIGSKLPGATFEFDLEKLPEQVGFLLDHYSRHYQLTLNNKERAELVEEFFVKLYLIKYGYISKTPLLRELELAESNRSPGALPSQVRDSVEKARKLERDRGLEKLRITLVRREFGPGTGPDSTHREESVLMNNAPMRIIFYSVVFGTIFLLEKQLAKHFEAGPEEQSWIVATGIVAIGLSVGIMAGYVPYYKSFDTPKRAVGPNQVGEIKLSEFVFDEALDESEPDDDGGRDTAFVDLTRLAADQLYGLGGMSDFVPFAWTSTCIFLDPPAKGADPALALRTYNTLQMYMTGNQPNSRVTSARHLKIDFAGAAALRSAAGDELKTMKVARNKKGWSSAHPILDRAIIGFATVATTGMQSLYGVIAKDKLIDRVFYLAIFNVNLKARLHAGSMRDAFAEAAVICGFDTCELLYPARARAHDDPYPTHDFSGYAAASSLNADLNKLDHATDAIRQLFSANRQSTARPADDPFAGEVTAWGAKGTPENRRQVLHLRCELGEAPEAAIVAMLSRLANPAVEPVILKPGSPKVSLKKLAAAARPALSTAAFKYDAIEETWRCDNLDIDLQRQEAIGFCCRASRTATTSTAFLLVRSKQHAGKFLVVNPQHSTPRLVDGLGAEEALIGALALIGCKSDFKLLYQVPKLPFNGVSLELHLERMPLVDAVIGHTTEAFGSKAPPQGGKSCGGVGAPGENPTERSIYRELQSGAQCGISAANVLLMYLDRDNPDRKLDFAELNRFLARYYPHMGSTYEPKSYVSLAEIKWFFDASPELYPHCAHLTFARQPSWPFAFECKMLAPDLSFAGVVLLTFDPHAQRSKDALDHTVAIVKDKSNSRMFYVVDSLSGEPPRQLYLEKGDMNHAVAAFMAETRGAPVWEALVPLAPWQLDGCEALVRSVVRSRGAALQRRVSAARLVIRKNLTVLEAAHLARSAYWWLETDSLESMAKNYKAGERQLQLDRLVMLEAMAEATNGALIQAPDVMAALGEARKVQPSIEASVFEEVAKRGGVAGPGMFPLTPDTICFAFDQQARQDTVLHVVNTLRMYLMQNDRRYGVAETKDAVLDFRSVPDDLEKLDALDQADHPEKAAAPSIAYQRIDSVGEAYAPRPDVRMKDADIVAVRYEKPGDARSLYRGSSSSSEVESSGRQPEACHFVIARDKLDANCFHLLDWQRGQSDIVEASTMEQALIRICDGGCRFYEFLFPAEPGSKPL